MLLSICSRRWKEVWRWDSCYSGICVWSMFPKLFAAKDTHCFAELFIYVISRVANESKVRELLCLQKTLLMPNNLKMLPSNLIPAYSVYPYPHFLGKKLAIKCFLLGVFVWSWEQTGFLILKMSHSAWNPYPPNSWIRIHELGQREPHLLIYICIKGLSSSEKARVLA